MIVAPISGSLIYEYFKVFDEDLPIVERRAFNKTCDVFALLTVAYTIIYLLFNVLPDIKKDEEEQRAISVDYSHHSNLPYVKHAFGSFDSGPRAIMPSQSVDNLNPEQSKSLTKQ